MASEKISAMPAATAVSNADDIPIVHALTNFKATRELLLTQAAAEPISLESINGDLLGFDVTGIVVAGAGSSLLEIDTSGNVSITVNPVATFDVSASPLGYQFLMQSGNISLLANTVLTLGVLGLASSCVIDAFGNVNLNAQYGMNLTTTGGISVAVGFAPTAGIFAGVQPTTLHDAVNRIGIQVAALSGGPIP